ncbi:hypothetical protein BGZ46_009196 [Entomortierella lignicola]|nr:hypothetical protein BGZ46_009196 [Entomortierella lignicola]
MSANLLFQIPELVLITIEHLTSHDIASLMRTCKNFFFNLEPFLWRYVTIERKPPIRNSLLRNRIHIQTLHINGFHEVVAKMLASDLPTKETNYSAASDSPASDRTRTSSSSTSAIANLQKITIHSCENLPKSFLSAISKVLSHGTNLVQLRLPIAVFVFDTDRLLELLSDDLPQLRKLSVFGDRVNLDDTLKFLLACLLHPRLADLTCDFRASFSIYAEESLSELLCSLDETKEKKESSSSISHGSIISAIKLPSSIVYPARFICRLLRDHLPYMKQFEVPDARFNDDNDFEDFTSNPCPNLEHITISNHGQAPSYFISNLLYVTTGIKSCRIHSLYNTLMEDVYVLDILVDNHASTLEEIMISESDIIRSTSVQNILIECKNLRKLWFDVESYTVLNPEPLIDGAWQCTNLQELALVLDFSGTFMRTKQIFDQIGRLTKLEKLALGWRGGSHLLVNEALDSLAGLENLQHFHMLENCWISIGQDEVEFLHGHWLSLQVVSDDRYSSYTGDHWAWLQRQRPYIQYP